MGPARHLSLPSGHPLAQGRRERAERRYIVEFVVDGLSLSRSLSPYTQYWSCECSKWTVFTRHVYADTHSRTSAVFYSSSYVAVIALLITSNIHLRCMHRGWLYKTIIRTRLFFPPIISLAQDASRKNRFSKGRTAEKLWSISNMMKKERYINNLDGFFHHNFHKDLIWNNEYTRVCVFSSENTSFNCFTSII